MPVAATAAMKRMQRAVLLVPLLLLTLANASFAQAGPAGDCGGLIAQANATFAAYRASVSAVARATGGTDYEPYCSALDDALRANEAADAATRRLTGSGCKTDAEKNVALIASDKGHIREGIPLCRANLAKQRAERDAKSREAAVDAILDGRARTNAGSNDSGQVAAPVPAPQRPSPTPVRGDASAPMSAPRESAPGPGRAESGRNSVPAEKPPDCTAADAWPNLGRCIVRKADRLRNEGLKMLDADRIFPSNPESDDPFSNQ